MSDHHTRVVYVGHCDWGRGQLQLQLVGWGEGMAEGSVATSAVLLRVCWMEGGPDGGDGEQYPERGALRGW